MEKILVTGASGFVGAYVCQELLKRGYLVRAAVRRSDFCFDKGVEIFQVGEINRQTDWSAALESVSAVVHLAARAHIIEKPSEESKKQFFDLNVGGTEALALQAAIKGVKRFVFMSSIKVNGERSSSGYTEDDSPMPEDDYGRSKHQAELALQKICRESGMEYVILRPPLVYGKGVKGNFRRLVKLAASNIPLPLGAIQNARSFIYVGNLAHAVVTTLEKPEAKNQIYLVEDGAPMSTATLLKVTARAQNNSAKLFPVPPALLFTGAKLLGKKSEAEKLLGSLVVNSNKIRKDLKWQPPYSFSEAIKLSVD
jgi:nucleoside-diphosphate-sugar epimerase